MAFQKGQSGNPGGRTAEKLISDALRLALKRDVARVTRIAEKVAVMAEGGDKWAISFLADRLEGKADANINVTGNHVVNHQSEAISATAGWLTEVLGAGPNGKTADADTDGPVLSAEVRSKPH